MDELRAPSFHDVDYLIPEVSGWICGLCGGVQFDGHAACDCEQKHGSYFTATEHDQPGRFWGDDDCGV